MCLTSSELMSVLLQVLVSLAAVAAFALVGIPLIGYYAGIAGVVKYWLMPWLGYHFWMSTFTVVHHTAPHIPFKPANEWNAAKAQLSGTVHCDYPKWCALILTDIWHQLSGTNFTCLRDCMRQPACTHVSLQLQQRDLCNLVSFSVSAFCRTSALESAADVDKIE